MHRSIEKDLAGWGGFPRQRTRVYRPEQVRAVGDLLAGAPEPHLIPRGMGRAYGDQAVNEGGGALDLTRLDRMLAFDEANGVLECEAGVTFADLIEVFLPRGWFPPVTPGTKFVTLGGALANDVHGKNHHVDGCIGAFVESFTLLTPGGEVLDCSRSKNAPVFRATLGGAGLTGVILTVRLRLRPVESAWMRVDVRQMSDLEAGMQALSQDDAGYPYSVAWIDCLASGPSLGRMVLLQGRHAALDELPAAQARDPYAVSSGLPLMVPFHFPGFALNRLSVAAFNAIYYAAHPDADAKLVDYDDFFYPLDSIGHWNRIYGKRGFVQYQVALPPDTAAAGLTRLLEALSSTGRASFLAVLKRFGPAGDGLLSFPFEGWTLSLDIPAARGIREFLAGLDQVVLEHGGRLYLGKDATTTPEVLAAGYSRLDEFREVAGRLDPDGRLSSSMARRLRLRGAS